MSVFRRYALAISTGAWIGIQATALAQPRPGVDGPSVTQQIYAQKVEAEVQQKIAEAEKLPPVRAAEKLRSALLIADDPLIPASLKTRLTASIKSRISAIDTSSKNSAPAQLDPVRVSIREDEKKRAQSVLQEKEDVTRALKTIASLSSRGDLAQAQKEAEALAKKYPDNPAAIVLSETGAMKQKVEDARMMVAQQNAGVLMAMRSLDKATILPKDDIEFDVKRWKEISKLRLKPTLTAKEQAILKSLDETIIDPKFEGTGFEDALQNISRAIGQPILLDKAALADKQVEANTPVNVKLRRASARTVLRAILQNQGLTFIIREQSIQVVTLEKARETLQTRVYYLGDLATGGPFSNSLVWGPQLSMMQMQENVTRLTRMVKEQIDPMSWKENGGNGSLMFNWPSMSLIVRQTAEVHGMLSGSLR